MRYQHFHIFSWLNELKTKDFSINDTRATSVRNLPDATTWILRFKKNLRGAYPIAPYSC